MSLISVTVIFHREGAFALPALSSMQEMVGAARSIGLAVEARAVLDRADAATRHIVAARGTWLDGVEEVDVGDLGLARNAGVRSAQGDFLAFLDGDDLWGREWLLLAHRAATASGAPTEAIWHPEFLYYFVEGDYDRHSINRSPHPASQSFYGLHRSDDEQGFDRNILFLDNIWSANVFAHRSMHERYPYKPVDRNAGFGIEDWSWNIETVWGGVRHRVVKDTVHLIRMKETGSLGQQNTVEGLLVHLPEGVRPHFGSRRPPTRED